MSRPCSPDFVELADRLGGISCDADPVATLRAPWNLDGWTLPVVELLVVTGAVLALVHAIARYRRHEPAWLALWVASVIYVVAIEPPLYFPETFGLEDQTGLIFAHNVFTVEFLYDRLPLYIVALYPASIYLAHALVDQLGVFRKHGALAGAVTVGVVHHLFYEIFDQLGPQLRWWAWNPDAPSNDPMFASVPLTSMVLFATTSPALLTYLARRFLYAGDDDRTRPGWALRTTGVGLATVVLQPVVGLPATIIGAVDGDDKTIDAVVLWAFVVVMAVVACRAVATSTPTAWSSHPIDRYPALYGLAYLLVFAGLWVTATPALLDATGGLTSDGTPTGHPLYALGAGLIALYLLLRVGRQPGEVTVGDVGSDTDGTGTRDIGLRTR